MEMNCIDWDWDILDGKGLEAIYPWALHIMCKGVGVSCISLSFRGMHGFCDAGWKLVPTAAQRGLF
jgi:hypothetical protein